MQFSKLSFASAALAASASATIYSNVTTVTTDVTVTQYTTYCPTPTYVTLTTCDSNNVCGPTIVAVQDGVTITLDSCVPTQDTVLTERVTLTQTVCPDCTNPAAPPTGAPAPAGNNVTVATSATRSPVPVQSIVSEFEGGAARTFVGAAAGIAAIVAALL